LYVLLDKVNEKFLINHYKKTKDQSIIPSNLRDEKDGVK